MLTSAQRAQFDQAFQQVDNNFETLFTKLLAIVPPDATYGDIAGVLREHLPGVADQMGSLHDALAKELYRQSRANAGLPDLSEPLESAALERSDVEESVRAALNPLDTANPGQPADLSVVTTNLLPRLVKNLREVGRRTVQLNVAKDPAAARYRRVAKPGACWFCLMLASRGYAYSADTVLKRSSDGKKYHLNCSCSQDVEFKGEKLPQEFDHLYEVYREATAGAKSSEDAQTKFKAHVEMLRLENPNWM